MKHKKTLPPIDKEFMDRRRFIKVLLGSLGGVIAFFTAWPFMNFLVNPFFREQDGKFVHVPDFKTVAENVPTKLTFESIDQDAFLRRNVFYDIWVVKKSASEAVVYSPLCTHLSCRYNWNNNEQQFFCPCHGSVFDSQGKAVAGPAPRGLDTLQYKIDDGELYVNWKVFKPGIAQKIES
jgi:menaquinol-cytochrome c reductase iron-sulfur subunit